MRGFGVFLGKELREIFRTWRIWVLPLIILGMAVLSPITALLTPALLESVAGDQPGLVFEIPDPTTIDSYLQWTKNLSQIVLFAVVISMAGMVSRERRSGTAALVLTKPISRSAMVLAKVLGNIALLTVATSLGALACWGLTTAVFDGELVGELAAATGLWLALAVFFIGVMALLSAAMDSQAAVAGTGLVVYLVVAILSSWGPARDYTPAGLLTGQNAVLAGESVHTLWPVLSALGGTAVAVGLAMAVFARREL